jgi:NAD(P)-dependent dehydrogenase (short-subunit alcohol dehydrogenase family)
MQRTALITGATGGLGAAVTQKFQELGFRTMAVARQGQISADLTSLDGVRKAVDAAGEVSVLLHLLGGFQTGSSEAAWDKMIELNLRPAARMINAVLPSMKGAGWGRILVIGSQAGESRPAGLEAYVATKAAVHALIQCTAEQVKGTAVTANAILPSTIDTEATRAAMPNADRSGWVRPDEIAATLAFLCSDEGAAINGGLIPMGS